MPLLAKLFACQRSLESCEPRRFRLSREPLRHFILDSLFLFPHALFLLGTGPALVQGLHSLHHDWALGSSFVDLSGSRLVVTRFGIDVMRFQVRAVHDAAN